MRIDRWIAGVACAGLLGACGVGNLTKMRKMPFGESAIEQSVDAAQEVGSGEGRVVVSDTTSKAKAFVRRDLPDALMQVDWGLPYGRIAMPAQVALDLVLGEVGEWQRGPGVDVGVELTLGANDGRTRADVLDRIAHRLDAHWRYEAGMVRLEAQAFKHHEVPTSLMQRSVSMEARGLNDSGGGSEDGGGGGGSGDGEGGSGGGSMTLSVDPSEELESLIVQVLDEAESGPLVGRGDGGEALPPPTVELMAGSGQVVAFGRPSFHRRLESALAGYLLGAQRRANVEIALYEVDVTDARGRSVSLTAVLDDIGSFDGSLRVVTGSSGSGVGSSVTGDDGIRFTAEPGPGSFSQITSVLSVLDRQGDTELAYHAQFDAQHGQLVSVEGATSTTYVSEVGRDSQVSGSTETRGLEVSTDEAVSGTMIEMMPFIAPDSVDLHINLSRAEVTRLDAYSFLDGLVQGILPTVEGDVMQVRVMLRDGESRLLLNMGRRTVTRSRSRVWGLPILSRTGSEESREVELVMLVTAKVMT